MDENFKLFRKTGEIKYYLKYKDALKKRNVEKNEATKDRRNNNRFD